MPQPLTFELEFKHRPFFKTLSLINRRSPDALDANTLEVLKYQFMHMYETNKEYIVDKEWKSNDLLIDLFDYIVSQFNKTPMRPGYQFMIEGRIDFSERAPHSWPLQVKIVPIEHNNLIIPLNWIIRQRSNVSIYDSLIMAFHHLYQIVGEPPDSNKPRHDNLWEILVDNKEEIPKEIFKRTQYWYDQKAKDYTETKSGEYIYSIYSKPENVLLNRENKKLTYQQVQMRLRNKVAKVKEQRVRKIINIVIELLDICKFNTTVADHASIMDFDTESGWPSTGLDLCEYIFDPYDFFGKNLLEMLEENINNVGATGYSYWSNLFYPKPESYFDSGFLELFIDKTQQLQLAIYELYKHEIYKHDKCAQWF